MRGSVSCWEVGDLWDAWGLQEEARWIQKSLLLSGVFPPSHFLVDQPTCPHCLGVPLSSKTRDICRVNPNHAEVYTAKVKSLKVNEPTALTSLTPGSPSPPEASSVYGLS